MFKRIGVWCVAICCVFGGYGLATTQQLPAPAKSVQLLDAVIATVNDKAVTQYEFNQFLARTVAQAKANNQSLPPMSQLKPQLFQHYLNRVLLLQLAKRYNITVTDKDVDAQLERLAKREKTTVVQLKKNALKQGYTAAQFRQEVREEIAIGTLQREAVSPHVKVSQSDINIAYQRLLIDPRYAKQYHLKDWLFPLSDHPTRAETAKARTAAMRLVKRLRAGKMAAKPTADLGWRPRSTLPAIFVTALKGLKQGGVAGPLSADNGFHVIQLIATRDSQEPRPTKTQMMRFLYEKAFQKKSLEWIARLRKKSDIQILVPQR